MIAALGMYDRPETAAANDRFWQAIRAVLGYGPKLLTRDMGGWEIWQSPELVFAQTCGMPYRTNLHGHVQLIGTPDYGLPGCPPGYYQSVFVVRKDAPDVLEAFHNTRFAFNEPLSQSGWAAPMTHLADTDIRFTAHLQSGAHAQSAAMVANRSADIAALDALTWALLQDYDPVAQHLKVIDKTVPTPGLPYITAHGRDADAIFQAVEMAMGELSAQDRAILHLKGITRIPANDYISVPTPATP